MSMADPYNDPRLPSSNRVGFNYLGDRVRGRVAHVEVVNYPSGPALTYKLIDAVVQQGGRQERMADCELIAGAANLQGQMQSKKPMPGDILDVTFTESKPNPGRSDTKIFNVVVEKAQGPQGPQAPPPPPQSAPYQPPPPQPPLPPAATYPPAYGTDPFPPPQPAPPQPYQQEQGSVPAGVPPAYEREDDLFNRG